MSSQSNTRQTPKLTAEQTISVLLNFGETLGAFARQLPEEERHLGKMLIDVADSVRTMAHDIGQGDTDVAMEIVRSSARLITVMRRVLSLRPGTATVH